MKKLIVIWLSFLVHLEFAVSQQISLQTFNAGGTATFLSGSVASFGTIGQPMVLPRITATSNGAGINVAVEIMFDVAIDNNPPSFAGSPSVTLTKSASSILNINATDAESTPRVYLYHRPIAGGGAYDSTQLTLSSGTTFTIDVNNLPASEVDAMGMEYYLKAFDSKPNVARHPSSGTHFARMIDPDAKVPAALLSYGNQVSNYRMISIPYPLSGSPADVFTDLGAADQAKYRLFRFESNQSYAEYPGGFNTVDRGKGYFIIQSIDRNTVVLKMGSQTAPSNSRSNLYQMSLHPGWNLIGNPYTTPINWDDVKNFPGNNGSALGTLKIWGSSGYSNATQLEPFQGAFVNVTGSQTITIPFLGQTTPGGRRKPEFTTDISQPNWKVSLTLRQQDLINSLSEFGMHPVASEGLDETDDFNPPAPFDYISIGFPHPDHPLKEFATDIVNPQPEYIWRFFAYVARPEQAELSWNPQNMGNHGVELYLYDVARNEIVDMRSNDKYVLRPVESSYFKIYYGTDIRHRIGPDETTLVTPYPNPFSSREPVRFSIGLPADRPGTIYPVQLTIRNSMGQVVHQFSANLNGGVHLHQWNGENQGTPVPQGLYVYTLRIGTKSFTGKIYYFNQP
ncbi:MAG: T9SS type A sorting domain-containing protein [Cyclobacteriaceae bacterium]|nr:T9SS type A sorting domain-containing protein [Cyclobacteriaceae bacterium]